MLVDELRKRWRETRRGQTLHASIGLKPEGLVLGADTLLASSTGRLKSRDGAAHADEARMLALLAVAYEQTIDNVAWSMAVQHGAASRLISEAINNLKSRPNSLSTNYQAALIDEIYKLRRQYVTRDARELVHAIISISSLGHLRAYADTRSFVRPGRSIFGTPLFGSIQDLHS